MRVASCSIIIMANKIKGRFREERPFAIPPKGEIPMPYKPKRPCGYPGCPKLADGRFCSAHARQNAQEYERYRRDPATRKRYGRAWKRIRDRYIARHPLCEECEQNGYVTAAEEVHHILPLSQSGTHDEDNLMALCTACHSAKTLTENNKKRSHSKA